jgi:hypothetical protein
VLFIVLVIARRFRSRAILELENLALRHQLQVLRRQQPGRPLLFAIDRLLWVGLYRIWPRCLDAMVLVKSATVIQWQRQGFRLFLTVALEIRTAVSGARGSQSDSADEQRQPALGSAPNSWRAAQPQYRDQPSYGRQVDGATKRYAVADLAQLPAQSELQVSGHRHVCRDVHIVSAALSHSHRRPPSA